MITDIDAITFDCYGTLIDWERGLRTYVHHLLVQKRVSVPVDEVVKVWEHIQFEMIRGPYQKYRIIMAESMLDSLGEFKINGEADDGRELAHAMGTWRPFKDVPEGLARLKKKFRLGIISNTDRDIIARTLRYLGVDMDVVVVAEDVRAYKPATAGFEEALKRLGLPAGRVLHAAFGVAYDLGPARRLGMKLAFVRRSAMGKVEPPPDLEVHSITELADRLGV